MEPPGRGLHAFQDRPEVRRSIWRCEELAIYQEPAVTGDRPSGRIGIADDAADVTGRAKIAKSPLLHRPPAYTAWSTDGNLGASSRVVGKSSSGVQRTRLTPRIVILMPPTIRMAQSTEEPFKFASTT